MARHDDALIEQAAKRLAAIEPTYVVTTVEPRLHKVPGRVSKDELNLIRRAVCRHLANMASIEDETDELTGKTLAAICRAWLKAQADTQSGKGGA